jgi:hypothetical protein
VMVCSLKTITSFAQPIIKVPPMCEVVVAGTGLGATTGFGGLVGDGGIVVMPDPFDYPRDQGNFYYISNEFELVQWELLGDLSLQTETSYNQSIQFVAGVNPVNIQSYNKKLRFGEMPSASLPNFDVRWARSKGRIVVTYYNKGCIGKIKFDVYKRYKNDKEKYLVPHILGLDCVLPNTVYTFSVDPIASDNPNDEIGFDNYYWSGLPEGSTLLYNSPDNSSITIKTGENVPSFTLQCCFGRANDWDGENSPVNHTTCVSKSIISTIINPEYIVAPPTCHPTGTASFTFTYNNPVGIICAWSAPNTGWTIGTPIVGATNTTVTVTTPNNNPGMLSLTINGVCQTVTVNYQVDRNLAAPLAVVPSSPTPSTCISLGGSGNYTISPNASANPVIWSTNPASITGVTLSNATTSTVTVNIASNTTVGSFSLEARSSVAACNPISLISTTIYLRPAAPTITGPTPACIVRGTTTTTAISCNAVAGATGYSWNLTGAPGWSIFANGNTVNPTFTPNGTTAGPVTLTVTALGVFGASCDSNPSVAYTVTYPPVAPAINAITCWNTSVPVVGSLVMPNKTLTINNLQNFGTYSVDANPALFSSASISGSNITLVNPVFLNTGTCSITIRHTSGTCTATTTLTITITAVTVTTPVTAVSFSGANGIVDNYLYTAGAGGVAFAGWFVSNATVIANGSTVSTVLNQLSLAGTTAPTSVGIYVNDNGCFKRVYSPSVGTKSASRQSDPNTSLVKGIIISPNPNDGNFTITALNFKKSATAILYDMNGRVIATAVLNKGENKIEKAGLAKGTYILSLLVDGKTEARKIIIK